MLKLEHVNKYFNKNKKNEIHVINETSLHMEGKGLVALLWPSGCGKTTLLNVIGGLDKVNSGQIFVNGQRITGRLSHTVDKIRNLNVGYVFQNYNLVDNMTVFDNVAIALRMVGVKDKKEIEGKLNKLLSSLTGRQREIIYLRFIHELEYEEIASLMHMTIQSSRKAVSRAIGKMRKLKVAFLFIIICLW